MTAEKPCPAFTTVDGGAAKVYCQGVDGHWGTHCGDRPEEEYERLLQAAEAPR